jgi:hypothetical protein
MPSTRDAIVGSILVVAMMSFLAGVSLMSGVNSAVRGEWTAWLIFALIPLLAFAATLHSRRILQAIGERRPQ